VDAGSPSDVVRPLERPAEESDAQRRSHREKDGEEQADRDSRDDRRLGTAGDRSRPVRHRSMV